MSDVAAFLLACIAEDEAVANAAEPGPWTAEAVDPKDPDYLPAERVVTSRADKDNIIVIAGDGGPDGTLAVEDATHIARWDPARVLAECAAMRAIVDAYVRERNLDVETNDRDLGYMDGLERAIRLLVQVYADRPGFDPAWRTS